MFQNIAVCVIMESMKDDEVKETMNRKTFHIKE